MIKPLNPKLYQEICGWWRIHQFPILPPQIIPYGYVSFVNDKPIFCGFFFHQDFMGWLTLFVVNPQATKIERTEGFETLCQEVESVARAKGIKFINSMSNHPRLMDRLTGQNYQAYDQNITHFLRILEPKE